MKNKAIFLDRDGVINIDNPNYTYRVEDFIFCNHIFEALKKLQDAGFLLIIITNQSGINKGIYTHQQVVELHQYMLNEFEKHKIKIDEIYYSPHHPDVTKSISRKPDSMMVEKAIARFNINPETSYFIGDRERDIEAGKKAGVKGILINSNDSLLTILPQIL